MGNDGGSIPYRRDLVKNKPKEEKNDDKALAKALWLFCALSKVSREIDAVLVYDATEHHSISVATETSCCTSRVRSLGQIVQQGCGDRISVGPVHVRRWG